MDKKTAVKHWDCIIALKEGKKIQYKSKVSTRWENTLNPCFDYESEYRVEPEPLLIPFTFKNADKLIGQAIKSKVNISEVMLIIAVCEDGILIGDKGILFSNLLNHYTFLDGSPLGITLSNE